MEGCSGGSSSKEPQEDKRYKKIKTHWRFQIDDPHLIIIPKEEAIDIDEEKDFRYAEFVYNKK